MSGHYNYVIYVILMMIGFYGLIAKENLIKKVIGLGLFQTGIFLFYISMAVTDGGIAPIVEGGHDDHGQQQVHHQSTSQKHSVETSDTAHQTTDSDTHLVKKTPLKEHDHSLQPHFINPLPHVLILTAIVVSVSVMAVALAVVINIKRAYGTIEIDEIQELEA